MGIFDFFKKTDNKSDKLGKKPPQISREVTKWADKAADKRAQNYDRQEAIAALADLCQPLENAEDLKETEKGKAQLEEHEKTRVDAAAALLRRFNFVVDPSITDGEEKAMVYQGIIGVGKEVLPAVRNYAKKAESLAWPMKITKAMLEEEEYVGEVLAWLSTWDTEYAKFIDPKIQLLVELEEHKDPRVLEAAKPFLLDVNETARFHAAGAILAQEDAAAIAPLIDMFLDEESLRVRTRICDAFISRSWQIAEEQHAPMRKCLPSGYTIDGEGYLRRRDA